MGSGLGVPHPIGRRSGDRRLRAAGGRSGRAASRAGRADGGARAGHRRILVPDPSPEHGAGEVPGRFQLVFDLLFVTLVVVLTGGERSFFVPLVILVIGAGALLLPVPLTVSLGGLAGALYLAGAALSGGAFEPVVLLQAAIFLVVAVVTADIGDRLLRTGFALGVVETELRRLRLDTHQIFDTICTGILTVDGTAVFTLYLPSLPVGRAAATAPASATRDIAF